VRKQVNYGTNMTPRQTGAAISLEDAGVDVEDVYQGGVARRVKELFCKLITNTHNRVETLSCKATAAWTGKVVRLNDKPKGNVGLRSENCDGEKPPGREGEDCQKSSCSEDGWTRVDGGDIKHNKTIS